MRSTEMQTWPALSSPKVAAALAARSMSASARTIIGSLPPSSRLTGVRLSAAFAITFLPVAVEPVNITKSASSTSAAPAGPRPVATLKTPSGSPAAASISAITSEVSGVTSDGFRITALPAASAGMQSPKLFVSGKFQGPITPTSPTGS